MKALSIQQPWASLIAAGIKDVENRTWQPKEIPNRILIHASKKCSLRSMAREYIEWVQEILNEQTMGNLPDFPDMPSNAIIGYFSIDRIDKKVDHSIWAEGEDDDEKLYYWHVKDCYLFDEPILDVKGKLHLWDYDMDEDNLPPAHQVTLYNYKETDGEVLLPINKQLWSTLGENQKLIFELDQFTSEVFCLPGVYDLKPLKTITLYYKDQKRKFRLTDETFSNDFVDSKGEPIKYMSMFSKEDVPRWLVQFAWAEEI